MTADRTDARKVLGQLHSEHSLSVPSFPTGVILLAVCSRKEVPSIPCLQIHASPAPGGRSVLGRQMAVDTGAGDGILEASPRLLSWDSEGWFPTLLRCRKLGKRGKAFFSSGH